METDSHTSAEGGDIRQERREKKLKKQRERMRQHGKSLIRVYKNAVLKRLRRQKK